MRFHLAVALLGGILTRVGFSADVPVENAFSKSTAKKIGSFKAQNIKVFYIRLDLELEHRDNRPSYLRVEEKSVLKPLCEKPNIAAKDPVDQVILVENQASRAVRSNDDFDFAENKAGISAKGRNVAFEKDGKLVSYKLPKQADFRKMSKQSLCVMKDGKNFRIMKCGSNWLESWCGSNWLGRRCGSSWAARRFVPGRVAVLDLSAFTESGGEYRCTDSLGGERTFKIDRTQKVLAPYTFHHHRGTKPSEEKISLYPILIPHTAETVGVLKDAFSFHEGWRVVYPAKINVLNVLNGISGMVECKHKDDKHLSSFPSIRLNVNVEDDKCEVVFSGPVLAPFERVETGLWNGGEWEAEDGSKRKLQVSQLTTWIRDG